MKIKLLFGIIILFFASCSVKDSSQTLYIHNNTPDTIIIEYNTTSHKGIMTLPYIYEETSNRPIIYSDYIFESYYTGIDILPLLTNDDLKNIIKDLDIYKIYNGDTIKLDIDYYNIENWEIHEFVDDEIRNYWYTLYLDKNAN